MQNMKHLDVLGPANVYVDKRTHEIVLAIDTEVGAVTLAMAPERMTQLGVILIREGGKQFNFESAAVRPQPEEVPHEIPNPQSVVDPGPVLEPVDIGPGPDGWRPSIASSEDSAHGGNGVPGRAD